MYKTFHSWAWVVDKDWCTQELLESNLSLHVTTVSPCWPWKIWKVPRFLQPPLAVIQEETFFRPSFPKSLFHFFEQLTTIDGVKAKPITQGQSYLGPKRTGATQQKQHILWICLRYEGPGWKTELYITNHNYTGILLLHRTWHAQTQAENWWTPLVNRWWTSVNCWNWAT